MEKKRIFDIYVLFCLSEINCGIPLVHEMASVTWNTSTVNYQCFDGSTVKVFCEEDGWDYPIHMCELDAGTSW